MSLLLACLLLSTDPLTFRFAGPTASEDATPNPFADVRLDVTFTHADGSAVTVPGFYAADGHAAETSATEGNVWLVKFLPPAGGDWSYRAEMSVGPDAALGGGDCYELIDGQGEFTVAAAGEGLYAHGALQYVGEHYLKFARSGERYLKCGVGSPETLLGYAEFDGTYRDLEKHDPPAPHGVIDLPALTDGLHRYRPHVEDWQGGDPTWRDGQGKGLVGGVNYLASRGVNAMYFLTMNVNGDGRNVWPWTGPVEFERFDVSKLAQWDIVFGHMQRRGVVMHVVLQETENDHLLDAGELGRHRRLYLRELVARFGHHPGVIWNLGEENTQTVAQQKAMSDELRKLDAYDHAIVIHNDHWSPANVRDTFDPLLGKGIVDGMALQDFHWNDIHQHTLEYRTSSEIKGRHCVVNADELGGAQFGTRTDADDPEHFLPRSRGLWGNLMAGGGGVEWYFGWQNNSPHSDLSAEDWRTRQAMYDQSRIAVDFFREHLPFWEMSPRDDVTLAADDYCLATEFETYCIYLPHGGATRLRLNHPFENPRHIGHWNAPTESGVYSVRWFDPRNGGPLQRGSVDHVFDGGVVSTGEPPAGGPDWVCLVRRVDPVFTADAGKPIAIEAEDFTEQTKASKRRWHILEKGGRLPGWQGAGKPTTWVRSAHSASASASGRTFLRLLPDTRRTHADKLIRGENFSPQPGKLAVLSYPVHFPAAGRYYVWVRAYSTGTEDNGLHVGLDGAWPESGRRMQWCEGKHRWTWNCAQRTPEQHCGVPLQIWLDVDEPGKHTVRFSMREDGFAFDKFLLTTDREYRPTGEGPQPRVKERQRQERRQPTQGKRRSAEGRGGAACG